MSIFIADDQSEQCGQHDHKARTVENKVAPVATLNLRFSGGQHDHPKTAERTGKSYRFLIRTDPRIRSLLKRARYAKPPRIGHWQMWEREYEPLLRALPLKGEVLERVAEEAYRRYESAWLRVVNR